MSGAYSTLNWASFNNPSERKIVEPKTIMAIASEPVMAIVRVL